MREVTTVSDVQGSDDSATATTIKSVERAATLLGFFTASRPRLTLGEITAKLGVSKATAHRYAVALRRVKLLRYDRATASYTLGPRALTLGPAARAGLPIITLAGPILEDLVQKLDETVVLSVWDGERPTVVRVHDNTDRVVRISVAVGARLGLTDSAQGRIFCAFLPPEEIPPIADDGHDAARLARDLAQIRLTGVAINSPAVHGVRTVAAPVLADGGIVAVIAVVGTATSVAGGVNSHVADAVRRAAGELSLLLGD